MSRYYGKFSEQRDQNLDLHACSRDGREYTKYYACDIVENVKKPHLCISYAIFWSSRTKLSYCSRLITFYRGLLSFA